jgi:NurA-like 5'-3' nuclease
MDFSYLLKKKDEINKKISSLKKTANVDECWILNSFENPKNYTFAGGDGSFNKKDYLDFCLYTVGTISYINKVGEAVEKSIMYWDTDIMQPYKYVSNRLRLYMVNMELKTILWNFINKNIDYYLFDGSLYSLLIQTHTYGSHPEYNFNGDRHIFNYYKEYYSEIRKKIFEQLKTGELHPIYDYNENERILFEQVEYIILLVELLKKYGDKVVGISKTSKMNLYFENSNVPDIALFSNNLKSGYSLPINLVNNKIGSNEIGSTNKNVQNALNSFKKFFPVDELYYQFLKLENTSGVVNITSLKKLDEKFFSSLKKISISGYPYILKKSHENVKITDKDMELCAKLLGIYKKEDRDIIL